MLPLPARSSRLMAAWGLRLHGPHVLPHIRSEQRVFVPAEEEPEAPRIPWIVRSAGCLGGDEDAPLAGAEGRLRQASTGKLPRLERPIAFPQTYRETMDFTRVPARWNAWREVSESVGLHAASAPDLADAIRLASDCKDATDAETNSEARCTERGPTLRAPLSTAGRLREPTALDAFEVPPALQPEAEECACREEPLTQQLQPSSPSESAQPGLSDRRRTTSFSRRTLRNRPSSGKQAPALASSFEVPRQRCLEVERRAANRAGGRAENGANEVPRQRCLEVDRRAASRAAARGTSIASESTGQAHIEREGSSSKSDGFRLRTSSPKKKPRLPGGLTGLWDGHSRLHVVRDLLDGYAADPLSASRPRLGGAASPASSPKTARRPPGQRPGSSWRPGSSCRPGSSYSFLEHYVTRQAEIERMLQEQAGSTAGAEASAPQPAAQSQRRLRRAHSVGEPKDEWGQKPV